MSKIHNFKYIIAVILLLFAVKGSAQRSIAEQLREGYTPILWDSIRVEVLDAASVDYYPVLFERYQKGDTTLNLQNYRQLYYGFVFDSRYSPRQVNELEDQTLEFIHLNAEMMDSTRAVQLIELAQGALVQEPFNIEMLNLLCYGYSIVQNNEQLTQNLYKLNGILESILSSGTGIELEDPWVVLYREDIADILSFMGGEVRRKKIITTKV